MAGARNSGGLGYVTLSGGHDAKTPRDAALQPQSQQPGAHRNAPHEIGQAQDQEPQAGYCHWAFQSTAEGRKSSAQEIALSGEPLHRVRWRPAEADLLMILPAEGESYAQPVQS